MDGSLPKRKSMSTSQYVDRLSDLPDSIIHHIMSLLSTKDATIIGHLSKRLLFTWRSFPIIDFDYNLFSKSKPSAVISTFLNFVIESLRRRCSSLGSDHLQRLSFRAPLYNCTDNENHVFSEMVRFALDKNVKELILDCRPGQLIRPRTQVPPDLPEAVFSANSIKTMELYGLELRSTDHEGFIFLSCALMENLTLCECKTSSLTSDFTTVKISGDKLRTLNFYNCKGFETIHMDKTSLESFSFRLSHVYGLCNGLYNGNIKLSSCKSLKLLELENIHLTDDWFLNQISELSSLETLKLTSLKSLKNIISKRSNNLKTIDLTNCATLENIEIVSLSLNLFRYHCDTTSNQQCKFNISGCIYLKDLQLTGANITDSWIKENINSVSGFQFLENLSLESCNLLEKVEFSVDQLKSLELVCCKRVFGIEIDAPNLVSFAYKGHFFPSSSPIIVSSLNFDAQLSFNNNKLWLSDYYKKLRDFVSHFGHCKTLTLVCSGDEDLIYPSEERDTLVSPLHDLKHLKLKLLTDKSAGIVELIDSLLWLAPRLKTISITSQTNVLVILKFYYKVPGVKFEEHEDDDHMRHCCFSSPIKCWRHCLTRVEMENLYDFDAMARLQSFFMKKAKATLSTSCLT